MRRAAIITLVSRRGNGVTHRGDETREILRREEDGYSPQYLTDEQSVS
jgi:hypothetical protein